MSDVFEFDPNFLKENLSLDKMIKLNKRRTIKQDKKELKSYFDRSTVSKYCTLCQNVNLDPSHPLSIHIIFIMFSK